MSATLIAPDEADRLAALSKLEILDTAPEAVFDRVTSELTRILGMQVSMMSFIDHDRQFIKSQAGFPDDMATTRCLEREKSLCNHVVHANDTLVVEDLREDPRFVENPYVRDFGLRFYAGTPLRASDNHVVGVLCVLDTKPRTFTSNERGLLKLVADGMMSEVKLRHLYRQLRDHTFLIEQDMAAARAVQRFLLPPESQSGQGYTVSHWYHPYDAIGGDFVDAVQRSDGSLILLLADVAGHGASAAITSAMTKTIFQRLSSSVSGPGALLTAINRELIGSVGAGRYMTAICALYDPASRSAMLANAGHPFPLITRSGEIAALYTENHFPLLIEATEIYNQETRVDFAGGDRLLFYTDGAIEAAEETGAMLNIEGLTRYAKSHTRLPGTAMLKALFTDISTFAQGKLKDDVALLSLDIL